MQDLTALTRAQLLDLHNAKARELGLRELASFKDHATAVARTADILAQFDDAAQQGDAQPSMARTYHDNDADRARHRGFPSAESYRKYRDAKNEMKKCQRQGDDDGEALKERHGERALLIEARQSSDGRPHLLAVLDADPSTLSKEASRLASQGDGGAPTVEVIDRATWDALQRLQKCGLIQFVGAAPRLLHESSLLAEDPAARIAAARAADLRALAERQLAKARVLAAGGFPEELPALITEAIRHAAAARLVVLGELAADAKSATPANVHDLVARRELPPEAATVLDELSEGTVPSAGHADQLLEATAGIISASAPPGPTTRGSI